MVLKHLFAWRSLLLLILSLILGLGWVWYTYGYVGQRWHTFTGTVGGKSYTVGMDSILSWRSFRVAMPGGGSDNIHGYIRLYDDQGRKLQEVFADGLKFHEPSWCDDCIVILGLDVIWNLPAAQATSLGNALSQP